MVRKREKTEEKSENEREEARRGRVKDELGEENAAFDGKNRRNLCHS